jgi:hypothetical protein
VKRRAARIRRVVGQQLTRARLARRAGDAAAVGLYLGSARSHRSSYTRLGHALYVRKRVRLALEDAEARGHRKKNRRSSVVLTAGGAVVLAVVAVVRRRREPAA